MTAPADRRSSARLEQAGAARPSHSRYGGFTGAGAYGASGGGLAAAVGSAAVATGVARAAGAGAAVGAAANLRPPL